MRGCRQTAFAITWNFSLQHLRGHRHLVSLFSGESAHAVLVERGCRDPDRLE